MPQILGSNSGDITILHFLGFAGALREIVRGTIGPAATRGTEQYARLLEAVADLIRALTAAPQWLALVAVGVILIVMGAVFAFPGSTPVDRGWYGIG